MSRCYWAVPPLEFPEDRECQYEVGGDCGNCCYLEKDPVPPKREEQLTDGVCATCGALLGSSTCEDCWATPYKG